MNNNDFFPDNDYKLPETSNYMRFIEGENTFRILSNAIVGYEYWNTQNKPVRSKERPDIDNIHEEIRLERDGSTRIKHFWAFCVYNYEIKRIQILELTQRTIMKVIQGLVKNPRWGDPRTYDITITKSGSNLDTEYSTVPNPKEPTDPAILAKYQKTQINLEALYEGEDPFQVSDVSPDPKLPSNEEIERQKEKVVIDPRIEDDRISPDDLPF